MSRETDVVVIRTIGIDTGKNTLHLVGLDARGVVIAGLIARQSLPERSASMVAVRRNRTANTLKDVIAIAADTSHHDLSLISDPIGRGFGTSLARPGGNLTGFTANEPAVGNKSMGLLKEIAPRTVRVALLFNPATAASPQFFSSSIQDAA
jgi:hypothetical protein